MPQFRRKPEVIEAEQWFPGKEIDGVVMKPNCLGGRGYGRIEVPPQPYFERGGLSTPIYPGDYITRSDAGFGVARKDYFESKYEPAREEPTMPEHPVEVDLIFRDATKRTERHIELNANKPDIEGAANEVMDGLMRSLGNRVQPIDDSK